MRTQGTHYSFTLIVKMLEKWLSSTSKFKGTHFYILFVVTAAGVGPCGSPKKRPRTSSIVQYKFTFGPLRSAERF